MKKVLLLILTLCATSGLFAQTFTDNGINYNVTSPTTVEVGLNSGFTGAAVIPSNVTYSSISYSVKHISDYAFESCIGLTSIIIPNSVTNIGQRAFWNCIGLLSVTFPNTLKTIDYQAFGNCTGLTFLSIPDGITYIGILAFANCTNLRSVSLPVSLTIIETQVFAGCTSLISFSIPNINTIGEGAFRVCLNLNTIDLPNSVKEIRRYAFELCTGLTSVVIPNSVTNIDLSSFKDCTSLNSVTVSWTIPLTISADVFANVPLSSAFLYIPQGTLAAYQAAPVWKDFGTIIESTFIASGINYKVTSPSTVEVGNNTDFSGDAIIPTIVTNAGRNYTVIKIGHNAFLNNSKLKSISIPNTVTDIGGNAFYGCWGLTTLVIPESVETIGGSAFFGCYGLSEINIPNSVTTFGSEASGLTPVIGYRYGDFGFEEMATNGCNGSTFVVPFFLQDGQTSINEGRYAYCTLVSSANIPTSINAIGVGAFTFSSGLKSVSIPNTVTNIGGRAFHNCNDLTSVTIHWLTPLIIDKFIFSNTDIASATLYVPAGTSDAYRAARIWQDFGTIIETTLPLTLTSLTAKLVTTGNQINWTTADVVNVKNITLERSGADNNFSPLVILPVTAVQYTDYNPLPGDNYYRLSSTDNDGTTQTYPQTAFVKGLSKEVSFYPNPVNSGVLNVVAGSYKIESVALFDLNGKKVVFVNAKSSSQSLAVSTQGLAKGVYVLEIKGEKTSANKKVVVE